MKDKGLMYLCIGISISVATIIAIKYNSLKQSYAKAEKEKLEYCNKYHEQSDRIECFIYEIQSKDSIINQMEKDYIEQWEENQIFSSMLAEIENEPAGHKMLHKLWTLNK
jgi:hypothetical protein